MNDFIQTLLGDMTTGVFWGYTVIAALGFLFMWILQVGDNKDRIAATGGFSIPTWIKENWPRVITSLIVLFLAITSYDDLYGTEISRFGAFLLGCTVDAIVDRVVGMIAAFRGKK